MSVNVKSDNFDKIPTKVPSQVYRTFLQSKPKSYRKYFAASFAKVITKGKTEAWEFHLCPWKPTPATSVPPSPRWILYFAYDCQM